MFPFGTDICVYDLHMYFSSIPYTVDIDTAIKF